MGIPVERLDPFAISDLSQLPEDERELAEKAPHEFAVAVGLAQLRLDPLAFDLEVLPAALRRRRDFATKGIYAAGAAVVALGILGVLYQGRVSAAAEGQAAKRKLSGIRNEAEKQDGRFREVLEVEQELAVKHQLLGDVLEPGALLAKAWSVLEDNLAKPELRDVYLDGVQLRVVENSNEFPYYREKKREKASGYEETSRRYGFRREPEVMVSGRVAGKERADELYAQFVRGCKQNTLGLDVLTEKRLRGGGTGKDATFELVFRPGKQIEIVVEDGQDPLALTLTDLSVDDGDEPTVIRGRRADGVLVEIPIDEEHRATRRKNRDVIEELQAEAKARAAAAASDEDAKDGN
jgi:hypothetical protein